MMGAVPKLYAMTRPAAGGAVLRVLPEECLPLGDQHRAPGAVEESPRAPRSGLYRTSREFPSGAILASAVSRAGHSTFP